MLGWLHVVPEGEKQTRAQLSSWPLPDCDKFSYLAVWFCELRLSFGYSDIESWSNLTGSVPTPEETSILVSMSSAYTGALAEFRSKDHNLIPPVDCRTQEEIDTMISEKMKRSLVRFKNAN